MPLMIFFDSQGCLKASYNFVCPFLYFGFNEEAFVFSFFPLFKWVEGYRGYSLERNNFESKEIDLSALIGQH